MALDSVIAAIIYAGNASTSTPYPVAFDYVDVADVFVSKTAQGTGTVTVTAGAVVFSSAQAALVIGSKIRIANLIYEIATRTSDLLFTFKTRPTISATTFHHVEAAVELTGADFTLASDGVRTAVAVAATALVTVYRRTPVIQPTVLPSAGTLPAASLEGMADRLAMIAQELTSRFDGTGVGLPATVAGNILQDTAVFADATARGLAVPKRIGQIGVQLSPPPFTFYSANGVTAGQWEEYAPWGLVGNVVIIAGVLVPPATTNNEAFDQPWTVLNDGTHVPVNIASITNSAGSFVLTVNYAVTLLNVVTSTVGGDEALCGVFDIGASVGLTQTAFTFRRKRSVSVRLKWDGAAWTIRGYNGGMRIIADTPAGFESAGSGVYTLRFSPWVDSQPEKALIENCDPGGSLPAGRLTAAISTTLGSSNALTLILRDSAGTATVAGVGNTAEFIVTIPNTEEFAVRPQRISQEAWPDGFGASSNLWFFILGKLV